MINSQETVSTSMTFKRCLIRTFVLICALTLIFTTTYQPNNIVYGANQSLNLTVDGKKITYKGPFYSIKIDGTTLTGLPIPPLVLEANRSIVPLREVFEALGAKVDWNAKTNTATVKYEKTTVVMKINSSTATINGESFTLEAPAKLISNANEAKTMIPLRFAADALGCDVDFVESSGTITIDTKPSTPPVTPTPPTSTPSPATSTATLINNYANSTVNMSCITFNNSVKDYNVMVLDNPKRLVIDIENASHSISKTTIDPKSDLLSEVRMAKMEGNILRIVYEFKGNEAYYKIGLSTSKNKMIVVTDDNKILNENVIIIDPGHGGKDPGAVYKEGSIVKVREADINLQVGLLTYDYLADMGYNVYMTRTTSQFIELYDRSDLANTVDASLFLSVHCNSFDTSAPTGSETYYNPSSSKTKNGITTKQFAQNAQNALLSALGLKNRGSIERTGLAVLNRSQMPAALVELGFISNASDRAKITNPFYQDKVALELANAIAKTLK